MPEDVIKPVGELKPITPKPIGKLKPIGGFLNEPEPYKPSANDIVSNIQTDNDNEKQMIKNLALRVNEGKAKHEDLTNAILTIQGQHKDQGGEKNYYVEETNGVVIPKPLSKGQSAPKDAVNVFNETTWYQDLGNSLLRGSSKLGTMLAETPAFIYDVAAIPQNYISELMGGEQVSSGTFKETFGLPENKVADYYKEQSQINQNNFNQKYDKGITDYVSNGEYGKAFGLLGNSIMESAPTTIGLAVANAGGATAIQSILGGGAVFGAGKKGELDESAPNMGENQKTAIALSNGLFEGIFEQFGITKLGGITKNALLKDGKEEAYKLALDGFKQSYRPVVTKYLGTSGEEALSEAATQFAQNAVDKYSGYKPEINLSDGVVDAAIVGFGAGAGYGLLAGKTTEEIHKQKIEKANEQSKAIYNIVEKGNDAIVGFKSEIFNAVKNGKLTKDEGDRAITKINAFKDYNDMLGSLQVDETEKRKLFDLSFQKQSLETELGGKDPKKLNPIEQGQYASKEKLANEIQKNINEIIFNAQAKEETNLPDKTVEDIIKKENPPKKEGEKKPKVPAHIQAILDRNKKEVSKKEYPEETRSYDEVTDVEEFNKFHPRTIHKLLSDKLSKLKDRFTTGTVLSRSFNEGKNNVFEVEMNDGKKVRFSSSMIREDEWKDGHLVNAIDETIRKKEGEFMVIDREKLKNKPVALKQYTIDNDGRKKNVIKIYNPYNGKFIAWAKETKRGKNDYTHEEVNGKGGLIDIERKVEDIIPPSEEEGGLPVTPTNTPIKPQPKGDNNVKVPTKDEYVAQNIEALKNDSDADYDEHSDRLGVYKDYFGKQYEEQFGKTKGAEIVSESESATSDTQKVGAKNKGKTKALVTGTKKRNRVIRDERKLRALKHVVTDPRSIALQYFIGGGEINFDAIKGLFKGSRSETNHRISYARKTAPSLDDLAHALWENNSEYGHDTEAFKDAIEDVVMSYHSATEMAIALNKALDEKEQKYTPQEEVLNEESALADKEGVSAEYDKAISELEHLTDESLTKLAEDENVSDMFIDNIFEKMWGKPQLPEIKRPDIKEGEEPFQKEASKKEAVEGIVEKLKKVLHKDIKIEYDPKLKGAGKWNPKTKTITINPKLAGKDTPIHEVGHILIDAMGGTSNRVIRKGIEQLKGTSLWKETAGRYPLSDNYTIDDLGMEVLAEAIGREGAGIFETEAEKSKFRTYLEYIFNWLKRELGLEKSIAKNLAKQVISGINIKPAEIGGKEQLQKEKEMSLEEYRKGKGRNIEQEESDLEALNERLEIEEDEDVIAQIESVIENMEAKIEADKANYQRFIEGKKEISEFGEDYENKTLPELIDAYVTLEQQAQQLTELEGEKHYADRDKLNEIKIKIGEILDNSRKEDLQKKFGKEITEMANKKDLTWLNVWTRTLGHMTEAFPPLQSLYNEFNAINLAKEKETYSRKTELDKKAKAVIRETNKKLGAKDWALGLITSNSAKYFNYLENNGKLLTTAEAKAKGLSKAQIEYLEAVRELVKEKNKLAGKTTDDLEVIKIDKGFKEAFKDAPKGEKFMTAMSLYMGGGENVDTPVTYTLDGKTQTVPYKDAQKALLDYSKKGNKEKVIALGKLLSISYKAKKNSYRSDKNINYNGVLTSKFDKPYDKTVGYSKDYHAATMQLIDDIAHVKHFNKLVPLTNAIELFYQRTGVKEGMQFGHLLEFMRNWKNEQIYQKTLQTDPTIDAVARFLRKMTSLTVMSFAVPANVMNIAIGNYNSIRKEGWITWAKGQKELFAGDKHRAGFGFVGKKANDINNKYQLVKSDLDSNPKNHIGKWFDQLAFIGTRFGEYQIQLSIALGLMKDAGMLDSFTYKNGELVLKDGVNEKEFEKKINEIKDKVSDIQGKYDPKDRRNMARYELGKSALQFKNWIPDWTKERFSGEYIDSKGTVHRGSWRFLSSTAIKEMKADMATHGKWLGLFKGDSLGSKNFRSNLNGLLFLATLYVLKNSGDDDEKKKRETLSLENAMEQVMFVYDPSQAKYILKSPIASMGIIDKFLTIMENIVDGEPEKALKPAKKLIPYNKAYDDVNYLLGNDKK